MIVAIYILLVVLPVLFWLWFFRYQDRWEPEPFSLIIKLIVIGGALAAFFSVIFEYIAGDWLLNGYDVTSYGQDPSTLQVSFGLFVFAIFASVVIEEFAKYIFLTNRVYFAPSFNQIKDGVVYGASLGLGFAFFENTVYFLNTLLGGSSVTDLTFIALARSVGPLMMHFITTGIVGLYMGKKKFSRSHSKKFIVKGLAIAITIHFIYNLLIVLYQEYFIATLGVIAIGALLLKVIARNENKMVWELIYTKKTKNKN